MSKKQPIGAALMARLKPPVEADHHFRKRNLGKGFTAVTHRLANEGFNRLRGICVERDISMQQLYTEAIDLWLASNSELPLPPVPPKKRG